MSYFASLRHKIRKTAMKQVAFPLHGEDDGTELCNKIIADGEEFIDSLRAIKEEYQSKFIHSNAPVFFPQLVRKKTFVIEKFSVISVEGDYVYLKDGVYSLKEEKFIEVAEVNGSIPYQMKGIVVSDQIVAGGCLETEDTIYVSKQDDKVIHTDLVRYNAVLSYREETYPDSHRIIFWDGANRIIYRNTVKNGDKTYYVFTIQKGSAAYRDYNGRRHSYVVPAKRWGDYDYHDCFYFNNVFCISYMDAKGFSIDVDAASLKVFDNHEKTYKKYYTEKHAVFLQGEEMLIHSYGPC